MQFEESISVLDVPDCEALLARMLRFGERMGFGRLSTLSVIDHPDGSSSFFPLSNVPSSLHWFSNDLQVSRRDPVMQHCKRSSLPIWWDQQFYLRAARIDHWEILAHHGYPIGLSFALHMPQGQHFVFGLSNDECLPTEERRWRVAAEAHLFAVFAQQAAFRLLRPQDANVDFHLSPMELEALRWTMEGKTTWEVGRILGRSERAIAGYLSSAARKMGCINKYQAVAKAIRLGLVK